ncbi:MAG: NAD(P)/FAD-dependent oxidoreductase [bacterium]
MTKETSFDVIVIGGGPAGTTAASILAEYGRRVLLLEKERFPRYRIGESLIPYCYFSLQRIGMIDKLKKSNFTKKHSVQFVSTSGTVSQPFYFFQHYEHESSTTWQVPRDEFDMMMLQNARDKGVDAREDIKVRDLLAKNGKVIGVNAQIGNGDMAEFHAPITIDASGRESLAVVRNGWRVPDKNLEKVAIWTYYRGAMRDPGLDEGATTIAYIPQKGWFWYLPLPDDLVSIGVIADKDYLYSETRDPDTIFKREIKNNPWIEQHLTLGKHLGEYRITGDYSYRSKHCAADGLVLIGDAFAFLDPVFSSGVFLALVSGEYAADAVEAALDVGDVSARQFQEYSKKICHAIEIMRKLVYGFYDKEFNFRKLFEKYPDLRGDVTDGLIGNISKEYNRLYKAMAEFMDVPPELNYGRPLLT